MILDKATAARNTPIVPGQRYHVFGIKEPVTILAVSSAPAWLQWLIDCEIAYEVVGQGAPMFVKESYFRKVAVLV